MKPAWHPRQPGTNWFLPSLAKFERARLALFPLLTLTLTHSATDGARARPTPHTQLDPHDVTVLGCALNSPATFDTTRTPKLFIPSPACRLNGMQLDCHLHTLLDCAN